VLNASDIFTKLQLDKDIMKLVLPEWFLCISRGDKDVKLPDVQEEEKIPFFHEVEVTVENELQKEREVLKDILHQVLISIGKNANIDTKKILEEKRVAVAQALQLQQKLEAVRVYRYR
jgi:predicted xylose isomerase-like sugar epimerase